MADKKFKVTKGCWDKGTYFPLSGAGTVGVVAVRLGRGYIGIELNPEYIELSKQRINGLQMEMDVI